MNERGSAAVEFVALALVLVVPVAFALGGVLSIVDARVAAQSAAATAALAVARDGGGLTTARRVANSHWGRACAVRTELRCQAGCRNGGTATVTVAVDVAVPFLPHPVTVTAQQTQVVDRFG